MRKLLLLAALLGGCYVSTVPRGHYARHHVVYVEGRTYVDRGVAYGEAPAATVIPQDDPPVGQLQR